MSGPRGLAPGPGESCHGRGDAIDPREDVAHAAGSAHHTFEHERPRGLVVLGLGLAHVVRGEQLAHEGDEPRRIERFLQMLHDQGWKTIAIRLVQARAVAGVVLAVSEFTATGSGANAGKTLNGRSSHVLTETGGVWLSAMHSAA